MFVKLYLCRLIEERSTRQADTEVIGRENQKDPSRRWLMLGKGPEVRVRTAGTQLSNGGI